PLFPYTTLFRSDDVGHLVTGQADADLVVDLFAQDGPAQRRVHADPAFGGIELVGADDAVAVQVALLVFQLEPGAEVNSALVAGQLVHDDHAIQALAEIAYPPVDLAQPLLAVGVFGVLGAVALGCGLGHGSRHLRPLHLPQVGELILQALVAFRRDVLGSAGSGWTITAHWIGKQKGPSSLRLLTGARNRVRISVAVPTSWRTWAVHGRSLPLRMMTS